MGVFLVKNEFDTVTHLKDTKFYLESKASFIHISSIAFKSVLILVVGILHFFGQFRG